MSKQNPKKKTSFSISEDVDNLLSKLAEADSRSSASMLEVLVKEAAERKGVSGDFVPTASELIHLGFAQGESSDRIFRYEKIRPCPGGFEKLVIETTAMGRVFLTRSASKREEMWNGWPIPNRRFFYELLASFRWLTPSALGSKSVD